MNLQMLSTNEFLRCAHIAGHTSMSRCDIAFEAMRRLEYLEYAVIHAAQTRGFACDDVEQALQYLSEWEER